MPLITLPLNTLQTTVAVSRRPGQEFLPVLCDEDGARAARPPQRGGQTQCGRPLIPGVCHLQGRAGRCHKGVDHQ